MVFALAVGIIVSVLYRIPGVVAFVYWVASMLAAMAVFFTFRLQLTTDAASGIFATAIISGMALFYVLHYFVKQVQQGSSLRQAKNQTY